MNEYTRKQKTKQHIIASEHHHQQQEAE